MRQRLRCPVSSYSLLIMTHTAEGDLSRIDLFDPLQAQCLRVLLDVAYLPLLQQSNARVRRTQLVVVHGQECLLEDLDKAQTNTARTFVVFTHL